MFGINDFIGFLISFFITFPICSIIHLLGHITFLLLFGAKQIRVVIGCGKKIASIGIIDIHAYYFWYGRCTFQSLKIETKWSKFMILIAGSLFNFLTVILLNSLILFDVMTPSSYWENFMYFSVYFAFLAFFPMRYPDGYDSDGKAVLQLIKNTKSPGYSSDLHKKERGD